MKCDEMRCRPAEREGECGMRKLDGQTLFLGATIGIAAVTMLGLTLAGSSDSESTATTTVAASTVQLDKLPIRGERSYGYLQQICELGPRFSGSPGMVRQQELVTAHFENLGATVVRQEFRVRHPLTGEPVPMANLIIQWHPERKDRILLCAHYDTRPFPDRDPNVERRRGTFIGANDGASGVAALMELGHLMPQLQQGWGVDFVLFDGEELVYDDQRDEYFLGSRYFSEQYVRQPPEYRYHAAVLLDMVADRDLQLFQERTSLSWADSRPLVHSIWNRAKKLGVREFIPRGKYELRDDHIMLHDIAGIPACDIIDFDYGPLGTRVSYWHTEADTPDKCSAESLAKVSWVVWEWLKEDAPSFLPRERKKAERRE